MKECTKCHQTLPANLKNFYKHQVKNGFLILKSRCKKCCKPTKKQAKKDSKIYYEKHKEKIRYNRKLRYYKKRVIDHLKLISKTKANEIPSKELREKFVYNVSKNKNYGISK